MGSPIIDAALAWGSADVHAVNLGSDERSRLLTAWNGRCSKEERLREILKAMELLKVAW